MHYIKDFNLPFQISDEQRDIILSERSSFVLGRSGTGKTTTLTTKLFEREGALKGYFGGRSDTVPSLGYDQKSEDRSIVKEKASLRQLFVTVNPRLCLHVKQKIAELKRIICGGSLSAESEFVEEDTADHDEEIQFKNLPNSFIDLPARSYPLVITFRKFLLMLDGTLGNSFFDKFDLSPSVPLTTFIKNREVTFERFDSSYWPHFNSNYTMKLDSPRVFMEIASHIKGGIQAMDSAQGRMSYEDYVSLAEKRSSTLDGETRRNLYEIYKSYEKRKIEKGEFDLADIVVDIHRRLRTYKYEGDGMQFVYIDETQDLSLSQIALLKCVCQHPKEGFVFCGDTVQAIAKEIDFRFNDVKALFYKKFLQESKGRFEVFQLSQNFRTHDGVLNLSQSTIDLISHFFPSSIDSLKPETSMVHGEPPVVLRCGGKNAMATIFCESEVEESEKLFRFGAKQVILVRDDTAKEAVIKQIKKKAPVLTILECKGLEYQDVLLYNFFGSSNFKHGWRLIYEYMNEKNLLAERKPCPKFDEVKHNILCYELKQLYVAITRTRQRLWICEDQEVEYSEPMFDYWRTKDLVQFKELNDSFVATMKVASTSKEWKACGQQLFYQNNFRMAQQCFENAGDSFWTKKCMAASLREQAQQLLVSCPKKAKDIFKKASETFEDIGMIDSAAQCCFDSGEYERAGNLYWRKCKEPDLKRAGECFNLAGIFETAAEVYAIGHMYSDCLNACEKGGLLDIGKRYLQDWEENLNLKLDDLNLMKGKFFKSFPGGSTPSSSYILKGTGAFMKNLKKNFISLNLIDARKLDLDKWVRFGHKLSWEQLSELVDFLFRPFCQDLKIYSKLIRKLEMDDLGKMFVQCLNKPRKVRYEDFFLGIKTLFFAEDQGIKTVGISSKRKVSPIPFLRLMNWLMVETSAWNGVILGSVVTVGDWLACQEDEAFANLSCKDKPDLDSVYDFVAEFLKCICNDKEEIWKEWVQKCDVAVLLESMQSLAILLQLNSGRHAESANVVLKFLDKQRPGNEEDTMPNENLGSDNTIVPLGLEAASIIFNSLVGTLVIIKLRDNTSELLPPKEALFIDLKLCSDGENSDRENILKMMYSELEEEKQDSAAGNGKKKNPKKGKKGRK